MKTRILFLFALLLSPSAYTEETIAPELSATFFDGAPLLLSSCRGKTVLLDFWASWCAPCKASLPWLIELSKKYKSTLCIIGISEDSSQEEALDMLPDDKGAILFGLDKDGKTAESYKLPGMPSSFLISPERKIINKWKGFDSSKSAEEEAAIKAALAK